MRPRRRLNLKLREAAMASDELRKKWGTIFMGEREATVEQLDAMQEPMRR